MLKYSISAPDWGQLKQKQETVCLFFTIKAPSDASYNPLIRAPSPQPQVFH